VTWSTFTCSESSLLCLSQFIGRDQISQRRLPYHQRCGSGDSPGARRTQPLPQGNEGRCLAPEALPTLGPSEETRTPEPSIRVRGATSPSRICGSRRRERAIVRPTAIGDNKRCDSNNEEPGTAGRLFRQAKAKGVGLTPSGCGGSRRDNCS
jgi:hypothetical protein